MTNNSDKKIAQTEAEYAQKIVQQYRNIISETPLLISLLYDADLLPEQIRTVRGAISMSAVVIAYKEGKSTTSAALTESRAETAAAYEQIANEVCRWSISASEEIRVLATPDHTAALNTLISEAEARWMQRAAEIASRYNVSRNISSAIARIIATAIFAAIPKGGDA